MAALRRKLGDPGLIETVYGHGFRLADPDGHQ
jgi:DNA-binding winged helix-turn-helix (wHTH) protein